MSSEVHRFEDFKLDGSLHELRRNGCEIHLERIPLEFLCLLLERSGQIVTRSEIVERVWGKGVFLHSESSINTAMRKIRRALHDDCDPPKFIVTIPGKGYRFIASVQTLNNNLKTDTDSFQTPSVVAPKEAAKERIRRSPLAKSAWLAAGVAMVAIVTILLLSHQRLGVPVRTFGASTDGGLPYLSSRPSIAVLPLVNLTGDPEQDSLIDGITDDLINGLTRRNSIFVIARTTSFTYKSRTAKASEIGRELRVRYLLEGSIHKTGEDLRVDTQLVDTATGGLVWAQQYRAPSRDTSAMSDEIVKEIAVGLSQQSRAPRGGHVSSASAITARALVGCHNPADFGAVPDDGIDDTSASQRAVDEALVAGGQVCFGRGRWRLSRAPASTYNRFGALSIHGAHVDIRGIGPETVLEVVGDQGGAGMGVISVNPGAHNIAIRDLTIDTSATTNTSEEFHAIDIGNGLGNGMIEDVRIENVRIDHPDSPDGSRKGDCVHIVGTTPNNAVRRITVLGAMFRRCARSDITVHKNVFDFFIQGNKLTASKDQGIDKDPIRRIDHHL
jgi:TolB-like protein/DNA-binding winged helix-turn-helix (wHTH) protein